MTSTETAWLNAVGKVSRRKEGYPAKEGDGGYRHDHGHKDASDLVGLALDGCLGAGGLVHEADDARKGRVVAHGRCLHGKTIHAGSRVAPVTRSPTPFSAGTGSPVMADSSIEAEPSRMTPSTGRDSPARTTTMSPTRTSSVGTSTSWPLRRTRAVLGARSMSALMAEVVLPLGAGLKVLAQRDEHEDGARRVKVQRVHHGVVGRPRGPWHQVPSAIW
jgi:hypothetical protein